MAKKKKSGTKKKVGSMGSEIMKIAKQIRRKSPSKKWTQCVKEAGKEWKKKRAKSGKRRNSIEYLVASI